MRNSVTKPRPGRRWRDADHQQRRDLIIHVALDLLHRRGLEAVTMRNVARRLRVGAMTLYTYVNGQEELRREMARSGFDLLNDSCEAASTFDEPGSTRQKWRGGTRAYVQFAVDNPNLYRLMFHVHPERGGPDGTILLEGFERFVDRVRSRQDDSGMTPAEADLTARRQAERFCIALHGLASLAVAARIDVLGGDVDRLLDDVLEHVVPD